MQCAVEVFTPGLEPQAAQRAAHLRQALEAESAKDALALLTSEPDIGTDFKSRMCLAVARK